MIALLTVIFTSLCLAEQPVRTVIDWEQFDTVASEQCKPVKNPEALGQTYLNQVFILEQNRTMLLQLRGRLNEIGTVTDYAPQMRGWSEEDMATLRHLLHVGISEVKIAEALLHMTAERFTEEAILLKSGSKPSLYPGIKTRRKNCVRSFAETKAIMKEVIRIVVNIQVHVDPKVSEFEVAVLEYRRANPFFMVPHDSSNTPPTDGVY